MAKFVKTHYDLEVYQNSFKAAMEIFGLTKSFPSEERFSMIAQIRNSSRSVCANLVEAWRKRRYRGAFVAKLSDAETEASETIVWLDFAKACTCMDSETNARLIDRYEHITGQIVRMVETADKWIIKPVTQS